MNYRRVLRQLGLLILVLSGAMLIVTLVDLLVFGWLPKETARGDAEAILALAVSSGAGLVMGLAFWLTGIGTGAGHADRREAVLLVGVSWFVGGAIAALPYYLWAWWSVTNEQGHPFHHFADCYFEAISGLTTTGATVLSDVTALPQALLLWRSTTHWLGGLGIVVLFVAVLPMLGVGGKRLYQAEAPGPTKKGLRPRIGETARVLWLIYTSLTVLAVLIFWATGGERMTWLEAVNHALSVMSTGGLSTQNSSIGHFDSIALDFAVIAFMILAGTNFGLFYQASKGRWSVIWRDVELRVYLLLKLIGTVVAAACLYGGTIVMTTGQEVRGTLLESVRFAAFQAVSLQTGTGFGTADYELWPTVALVTLGSAMWIGGCAGSTAGGVKVIRFWIVLKVLAAGVERVYRPNVVRPIKVGGVGVDRDQRLTAVSFVLMFFLIFFLGTGTLLVLEPGVQAGGQCDYVTAMTATVASLCNIGPGFAAVGPTDNFGWFTPASKVALSLIMVLGRLEVMVVLALFSPRLYQNA